MSVEYKITKTHGVREKEYVKAVIRKKESMNSLAESIQESCTLTVHDVKAALSAMNSALVAELKDGGSVTIDGLGTFSLSLSGEIVKDENGVPKASHLGVRSVSFRPLQSFVKQFSDVSFHRSRMMDVSDVEHSLAQVLDIASGLLESKGAFTLSDFCTVSGMGRKKALQALNELASADKLRVWRSGRTYIFAK